MDYLNDHSSAYLLIIQASPHLISNAATTRWYYIAESLEPVQASSGPSQNPTHTFTNPPNNKELDYLIVPGPDPSIKLSGECTQFFQSIMPTLKGLLTVCTDSMALAQTGILDRHQVCSNKFVLKQFAQANLLRKEVKWVGDRRWIVDGTIWSAAGITAGIDLAAEFARVHFNLEIVEWAKAASEKTPKPDVPDDWAHLLEGVELNRGY